MQCFHFSFDVFVIPVSVLLSPHFFNSNFCSSFCSFSFYLFPQARFSSRLHFYISEEEVKTFQSKTERAAE